MLNWRKSPLTWINGKVHHEQSDTYTELTNGWMMAPDFKIIGEYQRSVKEYPNIKPGEDFKGYTK